MAGVSGFEPELTVLETAVLTIDTIPLQNGYVLFGFAMRLVFAATAAKLLEFQASGGFLFIFIGHVVAFFALRALQNDVITHSFI
jgi:hypothetical protein